MEPNAEKTPPAGEAATDETTEVVAEETSSESPAPADGEAAEAAAEEGAQAEGEAVPEGEKPVETPKPLNEMSVDELTASLTEAQLTKVAQKFSNKTMAAARRAEREVEQVRGRNEQLSGQVSTYQAFVDQLTGPNPLAGLQRLPGWTNLKGLVQRCIDAGGEAKPKTEDEVTALRKRLDDREAADRQREAQAQGQASQDRVFAALEKEPDRFDLVLTDDGRTKLWNSIVAYRTKYGRVPNDKVFEMAEAIETGMTASLARSKKFALAQSAKTGTSAASTARTAASKTGATKTITNRSSSAGAVVRDYSKMTEKERDAAILADMRASGEL